MRILSSIGPSSIPSINNLLSNMEYIEHQIPLPILDLYDIQFKHITPNRSQKTKVYP